MAKEEKRTYAREHEIRSSSKSSAQLRMQMESEAQPQPDEIPYVLNNTIFCMIEGAKKQ
jgi:hypothetical protein